ncbi:Rhodanese-related sulfurtransferase [Synechococcus sp. PCC 7502]|uniref:rhodanese-like domain-containing protein n=1 Tax=Synechococcus sp. PCC 7502 TaxID=1173263 RepID=UPI00029FFCB7|nr:rhodanese-like domain-containing protein [Synechococcus sp. PCC 7502]AFY72812.1 Rhodanese-related sulfurtransferase [Synechococcus sp. PCC 7502]
MAISQVSVHELVNYLNQNLDRDNLPDALAVQLIDVREPEELAIAHLDGFINLPLSQFANWGNQIHSLLDRDTETLVLCHHGVRSMQMCQWLVQQGFTNVKNIAHGIDAYSQLVDDSIPVY